MTTTADGEQVLPGAAYQFSSVRRSAAAGVSWHRSNTLCTPHTRTHAHTHYKMPTRTKCAIFYSTHATDCMAVSKSGVFAARAIKRTPGGSDDVARTAISDGRRPCMFVRRKWKQACTRPYTS